MTKIAWVEEAEIPCEPGAEWCEDCDHAIVGWLITDNKSANEWNGRCDIFDDCDGDRRCPACLRAERRAALRARLAEPTKEQVT